MASRNQLDKKSMMPEGSTILSTQEIKVLCRWPPTNNFSFIKICDAGGLDDSKYMGA
jgi:hypothetical protein